MKKSETKKLSAEKKKVVKDIGHITGTGSILQ